MSPQTVIAHCRLGEKPGEGGMGGVYLSGAYLALGNRMGKPGWFEAGYMNQMLEQRSGNVLECNHTLMVSILSALRFPD